MSSPCRRSSRLRSATPARVTATPTTQTLMSLVERDESPQSGAQMNLDSVFSPIAQPKSSAFQHTSQDNGKTLETPHTATRLHIPAGEMHPSKVQQSTTKQPDSGLKLGFVDVNSTALSPTKITVKTTSADTPSKMKESRPSPLFSPSFEFSFSQPDSCLSPETQQIMDSVRDQAAKIKAQLVSDRYDKARLEGDGGALFGIQGRKIAKPKSKAGRYSDVHMQEFKKMDSIANHVSGWKSKLQPNGPSLKRSKSKAGLDELEHHPPSMKSFRSLSREQNGNDLGDGARAKRTKERYEDDASARRPLSRDSDAERDHKELIRGLPRSKSGLPSSVTTPTKASLARSASLKHQKGTTIPSLNKSPSFKSPAAPAMAKSEGSRKYLSGLARFGSMKSILHRPQPKFSDDPAKVAAGTHLPTPQGKMDLSKDLPSLPGAPSGGLQRSPTIKRVGFTPSTKSRYDIAAAASSSSKIPALPVQHDEVNCPTQASDPVTYPSLTNVTHRAPTPSKTKEKASEPGDFTFRANKIISFGPATSGITSSTIRQVRPSGIPTLAPFGDFPTIPHGMPNKKRRREEVDDPEDRENVEPVGRDIGEVGSPAKKMKQMAPEADKKTKVGMKGSSQKVGGQKGKGKGFLSLSRLNALARPKERR